MPGIQTNMSTIKGSLKFIVGADFHGNLKNLEVFDEAIHKMLYEAQAYDCPAVFCGDINDTKAVIRSEIIAILIKRFTQFQDVMKIIIVGNHDLNNHHDNKHSLLFLKMVPNVILVDHPQSILGGWWGIPYYHSKKELEAVISELCASGVRKIFMHQGFQGAKQSDYILDKSSISPKLVKDCTIVTGHYHGHQFLGNIFYSGSPYTVTFAEVNQDKFIWLITDDENGIKYDPIKPGIRRHVQITLLEGEDLDSKFDSDIIKPKDIVKVLFKGSKDFCLSANKKEIQKKIGVENLIIATELISKKTKRIDAEKINKPLEVVNEYLNQSTTELNKSELKEYLGKVTDETN